MNHLKLFENFNSNSKLYWEIEESDFTSSDVVDVDMSQSVQAKIQFLIGDEFIVAVKESESGPDKKFKFIKIRYDLSKSTINARKFECSIFQIEDDYFMVEFESWFGKIGEGDWSTRYYQCDTIEGLSQLLQELGLTK